MIFIKILKLMGKLLLELTKMSSLRNVIKKKKIKSLRSMVSLYQSIITLKDKRKYRRNIKKKIAKMDLFFYKKKKIQEAATCSNKIKENTAKNNTFRIRNVKLFFNRINNLIKKINLFFMKLIKNSFNFFKDLLLVEVNSLIKWIKLFFSNLIFNLKTLWTIFQHIYKLVQTIFKIIFKMMLKLYEYIVYLKDKKNKFPVFLIVQSFLAILFLSMVILMIFVVISMVYIVYIQLLLMILSIILFFAFIFLILGLIKDCFKFISLIQPNLDRVLFRFFNDISFRRWLWLEEVPRTLYEYRRLITKFHMILFRLLFVESLITINLLISGIYHIPLVFLYIVYGLLYFGKTVVPLTGKCLERVIELDLRLLNFISTNVGKLVESYCFLIWPILYLMEQLLDLVIFMMTIVVPEASRYLLYGCYIVFNYYCSIIWKFISLLENVFLTPPIEFLFIGSVRRSILNKFRFILNELLFFILLILLIIIELNILNLIFPVYIRGLSHKLGYIW